MLMNLNVPTEEGPLDLVADAAGGELEVVHHLLALLVQGQEGAVRVLLLADGPGRFEFELIYFLGVFFSGKVKESWEMNLRKKRGVSKIRQMSGPFQIKFAGDQGPLVRHGS